MLKTIAIVAALAAAAAQSDSKLADVTGTWVINMESHQLGLELEQKESKIEGVLHARGQRILLIGTYVDRKLELKGDPADDHLPGASDAGPITATMQDDGTLAGELSTNHGRMKWVGERFKKP